MRYHHAWTLVLVLASLFTSDRIQAEPVPWFATDRFDSDVEFTGPIYEAAKRYSSLFFQDRTADGVEPYWEQGETLAHSSAMAVNFSRLPLVAQSTVFEQAFFHSSDPANLAVYYTSSNSRVYLNWTPDERYLPVNGRPIPDAPALQGYRIERKVGNGSFEPHAWVTTNSFDEQVAANMSYDYRIASLWSTYPGGLPYSYERHIETSQDTDTAIFLYEADAIEEPQDGPINFTLRCSGLDSQGDDLRLYSGYSTGTTVTWDELLINVNYSVDYLAQTINISIDSANWRARGTVGIVAIVDGLAYPQKTYVGQNLSLLTEMWAATHNNRICAKEWLHWIGNPTNEDWRAVFLDRQDDVLSQGYAGSFVDLARTSVAVDDLFPFHPIESVSGGALSVAINSMLESTQNLGLKTAPNAFTPVYFSAADYPLLEVDGTTGCIWISRAQQLLSGFQYPGLSPICYSAATFWYEQPDPYEQVRWARFTDLATYLIVAPDPQDGFFGYRPHQVSSGSYDILEFYPELFLDLGEPGLSSFWEPCQNGQMTPSTDNVQWRKFERGVVLLNIRDYAEGVYDAVNWGDIFGTQVPPYLWEVVPDDVEIQDGGVLGVRQVPTIGLEVARSYPMVLLFEPFDYPEIATSGALVADGCTSPKLMIRSSEPLRQATVFDFEGTMPWGIAERGTELTDDGLNGDEVAGDGIYTAELDPISSAYVGVRDLSVWTRDVDDGLLRIRDLEFAAEDPPVSFHDGSASTEDLYDDRSGYPYGACYFDAGALDTLLVTTVEYDDGPDGGQVFRKGDLNNGVPRFANVEVDVMGPGNRIESHHRGLTAADYDNDGATDLFVGSATPGESRLYKNTGVSLAAQPDTTFNYPQYLDNSDLLNASWIDYDLDGWVDLAVSMIELTPSGGDPTYIADFVPSMATTYNAYSVLYHNDCGSGFQLWGSGFANLSFGHVWVDLDRDGDQDLVVADLVGIARMVHINGWNSQGKMYALTDQTTTWLSGLLPLAAKSVTTLDYNHDGYMDIAFAGVDNALDFQVVLLRNTGTHFELDAAANAGFSASPSTEFYPSGIVADDVDLDGWEDLIVFSELPGRPRVYFNLGPGDQGFREVRSLMASVSGVSGAALADYNGDGDTDFYFGTDADALNLQPFFYRNLPAGDPGTQDPLPDNNWIKFGLEDQYSGQPSIGGSIRIFYGDQQSQTKVIDGGQGRAGQKQPTLTFGLGAYTQVDSVLVTWPDGFRETKIGPFTARQTTPAFAKAGYYVLADSHEFTYVAYPGSADWSFRWKTNYHTDKRFDQVAVEYSDCGTSDLLTWDRADVIYEQYRSGNEFVHSLTWLSKCCVPHKPAIYRFRVYSGYTAPSGEGSWSAWKYFGPKACIQQQ